MPRPRAELISTFPDGSVNPEPDLLSDPGHVVKSEYNFEKELFEGIEEDYITWNHYLNYQDINHDGGGVTSNRLFQLCRNSLFGYNQEGNLGEEQGMYRPADVYFNPIVLPKRITEYDPKTHKIKAFQYKDPSKNESTPNGKSLSRPDIIIESSSIRDTEKANKLGLKEDITPSYYFDPASRTFLLDYFERLQETIRSNEEKEGEGFTAYLMKYGFKGGTPEEQSNVHIKLDPRSKDGTVLTMEVDYYYCNPTQSMPNFGNLDRFEVSIASNGFVCSFDNNKPVVLDDKDPSNYLQGNPTKNKFFKDNVNNITNENIIHGRRLIVCKLLGDLLHAVFATTNQIVFTNDSYLRDRCIYNGISVVANEQTNMRVIESKHSSPFRLFFTDELFTKIGTKYQLLGGVPGKQQKNKPGIKSAAKTTTKPKLKKSKEDYEDDNVVGVFKSNEVRLDKNANSLFRGDTKNKIMGIKTYSYYSLCQNRNNFVHPNDQEFITNYCEEKVEYASEDNSEETDEDDSQEMDGGDPTDKPILIEFADEKFDEYMTSKEYSFVSLFQYIKTFTNKDLPKVSREEIKDLKYDSEILDCIEQHGLNDGNLEEKINLFYELVELAIKNNKLDELDIELFYLKNIHAKKGGNNEQLLKSVDKLNEVTSQDGIYLTNYDLLEYLYNTVEMTEGKDDTTTIVDDNTVEMTEGNNDTTTIVDDNTVDMDEGTDESREILDNNTVDMAVPMDTEEQPMKSLESQPNNKGFTMEGKPINKENVVNPADQVKKNLFDDLMEVGGKLKKKKTSLKKKKPRKKQSKSKKTKRIQIKKRKQTKKKKLTKK